MLQPLQKNEAAIQIKGVEVPREQLKRHLKSGLHSLFLFELAATLKSSSKSELLFKEKYRWKVYYDLWDEVYRVTVQGDDNTESKMEFKTLENFFTALENPQFRNLQTLVVVKNFPKNGTLGIRILLNPVSQETVERVKKWVHQRRVLGSSGAVIFGAKSGEATQEGTPRFLSLFNEILGYEMNDAKQDSAWAFAGVAPLLIQETKQ
ncbi:MAG TPA: hypothetical protein VIG33_17980 [Pseudobdellovibrionaceae bacterium]|jgi:hypothetical protein